MKGYLQVYTGNGKGKSTASFGLALRARGAGLRVKIIQFIKSRNYSEIGILKQIGVEIQQFGRGCFIFNDPAPEDIAVAEEALKTVRAIMTDKDTDLLILDEINVAWSVGLFNKETFRKLIDQKPDSLELICTGRNAPDFLIEKADLVTEMKEIKHYYQAGVEARNGIER